ncbi:RnfABCDGE type electron transport complex subunit D [Roseisalinus antarcticus]|uniref:Na(+)-translocating NADH-quinone reductase subunit B n=1 Tax=Roseisalinus antarcticus TaxID=254357 RepID=A0A1Y5RVR4_9RHOB|nr:RnfABCDGE type electron transport complex subunit D [Roseisalinus antarcticus]SLN26197.1 Na(+)-translocating NADH-quinone reductase subunit B [Roseisalinus antarcticus]
MIRGLWDREMVALLLLAALMPMALVWIWFGGAGAVGRLGLALIVSGAWHLIFMLARAQPPSFAGAITALAVAMLAPEDMGLVRIVLGISFGAVFGELVFGGWGRNVLNPATVTLAFLGFGFPTFAWPDFVLPVAWAAIPAAGLGVLFGVMPFGILAGAALVGGGTALLAGGPDWVVPAAAMVLVLLVADPVASASTALGRWLNGALYAALVLLFASGWEGASPVQLCVAAALLASLAAPLLDDIAIALWTLQRRRRHGGS